VVSVYGINQEWEHHKKGFMFHATRGPLESLLFVTPLLSSCLFLFCFLIVYMDFVPCLDWVMITDTH